MATQNECEVAFSTAESDFEQFSMRKLSFFDNEEIFYTYNFELSNIQYYVYM